MFRSCSCRSDFHAVQKQYLASSPLTIQILLRKGAHHSDLSHVGPTPNDTPDVKEAFVQISKIIGGWLDEVQEDKNE